MLQCFDGDQEQEHDDELADTEEEVNQAWGGWVVCSDNNATQWPYLAS